MTGRDETDPKGLIFEAYRIDGITGEECRSIFLDWALSLPVDSDNGALIQRLLKRHAGEPPDHPMTQVLTDGLTQISTPRRRGGWRSRPRG